MTLGILLATLLSSGTPAQAKGPYTYVVARHDILGYISLKHYGTSRKWRQIARWNHLKNPHRIELGQTLTLKERPTLSLQEGLRRVALAKAEHRSRSKPKQRSVASYIAPKPDVAAHQTPAKAANLAYARGDYRSAGKLFTLERKNHPDRITPWLYELSALKLSGNLKAFLSLRKDFVARFPSLASLDLLKPPPPR